MNTHPDCKCGFWLNSGYDDCPLKECNHPSEWNEEKQRYYSRMILIDPKEKCILVDQITKE